MRLAPVAFAILFGACGSGSDSPSTATGPSPNPAPSSPTSPTAPPASGCSVSIAGVPSLVAASSGRYSFTITTASNCAWAAGTDVPWAKVEPDFGQGQATAALTVEANTASSGRTANMSVSGQLFRVIQSSCPVTVNPTRLEEGSGGGNTQIAVTTSEGCRWTAVSSESWVRVRTPSGTGSGMVALELTANTGDVRHAFVTIGGQRVNITQRAR